MYKAREQATQQTLDALRDLAPQIQVTNAPESGSGSLVDPQEIADALSTYRNKMISANYLRNVNQNGFNYQAAAARNKQELRRALERASQRRAPSNHGPLM